MGSETPELNLSEKAHYYLGADLTDYEVVNALVDDIFLILDYLHSKEYNINNAQALVILATILREIITENKIKGNCEEYITSLLTLSDLCMRKNKTSSDFNTCIEKFQFAYKYTSGLKLSVKKMENSIPKEIRNIYNQNISDKEKAIQFLQQAIERVEISELPEKLKRYTISEINKIIEQLRKEKCGWHIVNNKLVTLIGLFGALASMICASESILNIKDRLDQTQKTIEQTSANHNYFDVLPVQIYQVAHQQKMIPQDTHE